jgi:hypothetical protein
MSCVLEFFQMKGEGLGYLSPFFIFVKTYSFEILYI